MSQSQLIYFLHHSFQVICSDKDPPIKPRKEYWLRTVRIVATRLNELADFVHNKILKQNAESMNVEKQLKDKYEKDKQIYNLYQGLIARDKDLHTLQLDVYELKCTVLKVINGENAPLPSRPKYKPLPDLDIVEPSPPIFFGQWHTLFKILPSRRQRKLSPVSQERRRTEAALKGVEKFKDLLRKKVANKRARKAEEARFVNGGGGGNDSDGEQSDFEEIEMSEVETVETPLLDTHAQEEEDQG